MSLPLEGAVDEHRWLMVLPDHFTLSLYIQPGAKSTQVSGLHDGALKIRLAAPPVEGKANNALLAYLAKLFGCAKRDVVLVSGMLCRHKVVRIERGVTQQTVLSILGL